MARLIVNPGSPKEWEIQLRTGRNQLGRDAGNDFTIHDPSISGSHCQIVVQPGSVFIRDLGSTNGTCVNNTRVREAVLQPGQTVQLGSVQMLFESDGPIASRPPDVPVPPPPSPAPMRVPPKRAAAPPAAATRPAPPVVLPE